MGIFLTIFYHLMDNRTFYQMKLNFKLLFNLRDFEKFHLEASWKIQLLFGISYFLIINTN